MEEEFGPDFYTVTDEDGNEFELELLDTLEKDGIIYHAFFPATEEDEETGEILDVDADTDEGIVILKVIEEDGEEILSSLDTDEEVEALYQLFMDRFFEDEEE